MASLALRRGCCGDTGSPASCCTGAHVSERERVCVRERECLCLCLYVFVV